MQSITVTPAEALLQRLLQSEKLESKYAVSIEKKEGCTYLYFQLSTAEPFPLHRDIPEKEHDFYLPIIS